MSTTGRRAALARWLTGKDNPLTARVMVNRLWQHHFGVGIVATPSDFGAMGDAATHPELLDWLAVEFMDKRLEPQAMHRLMVLSATYCQDSEIDRKDARCKAWNVDRDEHLLWHARRQRLEGEAVHDAMLAVTGELNPRMFGVSARPKLPATSAATLGRPTRSRKIEPPGDLRFRQKESALSPVRRIRPAGPAQQLLPSGRYHHGAASAAVAERRIHAGSRPPSWRRLGGAFLRRRGSGGAGVPTGMESACRGG